MNYSELKLIYLLKSLTESNCTKELRWQNVFFKFQNGLISKTTKCHEIWKSCTCKLENGSTNLSTNRTCHLVMGRVVASAGEWENYRQKLQSHQYFKNIMLCWINNTLKLGSITLPHKSGINWKFTSRCSNTWFKWKRHFIYFIIEFNFPWRKFVLRIKWKSWK